MLLVSLPYTRCRPTHRISSQCRSQCWVNASKLSTTLTQHYTKTGSAVYLAAAPQETRVIYPKLFQCWPNVLNAGPALEQHWVIVPCLLRLFLRNVNHFPHTIPPFLQIRTPNIIAINLIGCWSSARPIITYN